MTGEYWRTIEQNYYYIRWGVVKHAFKSGFLSIDRQGYISGRHFLQFITGSFTLQTHLQKIVFDCVESYVN